MGIRTRIRLAFTTDNKLLQIFLGEFLGTFVLITLGNSSVAQNVLSGGVNGLFMSINLSWGIAVAMGVWAAGPVSGGHINPAVTLAKCIMGRCSWKELPVYWVGQYLGAFVASAVIYGVYIQAINDKFGEPRDSDTWGIWATYPAGYLTVWGGLGDQIVSTALLMLLILAITDDNNMAPPTGMVPFCVGLIVTVIGMSLGHNCGYPINPARDLAPRFFTAIAGWGEGVFTASGADDIWWFWVPIVGPHIGAILGSWMYLIFVGNHLRGRALLRGKSDRHGKDDKHHDHHGNANHDRPRVAETELELKPDYDDRELDIRDDHRGVQNRGFEVPGIRYGY